MLVLHYAFAVAIFVVSAEPQLLVVGGDVVASHRRQIAKIRWRSDDGAYPERTAKDEKEYSEYYKEHYKIYMDQVRYFGQSRNNVAWFPATITVAVATFVIKENSSSTFVASLVTGIILPMIFLANCYMHINQVRFLFMARCCEERWRGVRDGSALTLLPYNGIKQMVKGKSGLSDYVDAPSVLLFAFLLAIGAIPLLLS